MTHASEERRQPRRIGAPDSDLVSRIVQQGIALQYEVGTIGAIEYLKAYGIQQAIIQRVLTSTRIRGEDIARREHQRQFVAA